jgi:hypothetical protein
MLHVWDEKFPNNVSDGVFLSNRKLKMMLKKLKCPKKLKPFIPLAIVLLYFLVGIVFYNTYEGWNLTQSVFFTVVTISTVGKFINPQ